MRVKLRIQENFKELEVHVCYHERNAQVEQTAAQIAELLQESIPVTDGSAVRFLPVAGIIRCYAERQKVLVQTSEGTFQAQQKLYELEEILPASQFVRISRSEIVNLRRIRRLDLDLAGTIKVILSDGTQTWTSRRCIPKLKQALGLVQSESGKGGEQHEK